MRDRLTKVERLLRNLATKRGVILTLVVVVSTLGAGLAIFQGEPVDDSSTVEETTTTEAPDRGPTETSTVSTEGTETTSWQGNEDGEIESDGGTPPPTHETTASEETPRTTSETTETTTTTTTSDDGPGVSVSGESNASASSLTRVGVER